MPEGVDPVLEASAVFDPPNWTFPSGTHICVVEVDPETGSTRIDRYVAVDDCGTIINPMVVDGQVMGGVAQGIAEALYEEALYDENGILLTGNMMTYRVPSAAELPGYTLDKTVTPSSTNPMGVKGIGETGTLTRCASSESSSSTSRPRPRRSGESSRTRRVRRRPSGRPRAAAPARPV
jgi:carbon-monoxide dehydrogenase large subunit